MATTVIRDIENALFHFRHIESGGGSPKPTLLTDQGHIWCASVDPSMVYSSMINL